MAHDGIRCPKCMKDWMRSVSVSPQGIESFECMSCGKEVVLDARPSPRRVFTRIEKSKGAN